MKLDVQTFTDLSYCIRNTFYETWFNDKTVIVTEKKKDGRRLATYDFSFATKTITGNPKTECIWVQEVLQFLKTTQRQPTVIEQKQ